MAVASIEVSFADGIVALGKFHIDDVAHVLFTAAAEHALDAHALEARLVEVDAGAAHAEVVALGVVVGNIGHELGDIGVLVGTEGEQLVVINIDAVVQVVGVDEVALGVDRRHAERAIVVAANRTLVNEFDNLGIGGRCSMVEIGGDNGLAIYLLNARAGNSRKDVVGAHCARFGIVAELNVIEQIVVCINAGHVQEQTVPDADELVAREYHLVAVKGAFHDTVGYQGREALYIDIVVHHGHLDHLACRTVVAVNVLHREVFQDSIVGQLNQCFVKRGVNRLPVDIAGPREIVVIDQAQSAAFKGVHVAARAVERNRAVVADGERCFMDVKVRRGDDIAVIAHRHVNPCRDQAIINFVIEDDVLVQRHRQGLAVITQLGPYPCAGSSLGEGILEINGLAVIGIHHLHGCAVLIGRK